MFSLGRTPYPGVEPGQELYAKLAANYRMSRPELCPHDVYKIMLDCWSAEPKHRPRSPSLSVLECKRRIFFTGSASLLTV